VKSLDVKVWGVRKRDTKTPSYGVRWSVAGNVFSDSFRTKALADHYRAKLMSAMRGGEEFDTETGLPASMEEKKSPLSWYDFALRYLAMKWPHAAPNTRDGINESLTSVTMELLTERAGRPSDEEIRKALRNWAFVLPGPDDREVPDNVRNVLHWVAKASRPLADLVEPATARAVLDGLKLKLDGTAAAAETVRRKRRTLVNAANYAVDLGELRENPITAVRWQKPKVSNQVDPRVVANPEQARNLLAAVSYVGGYRRARGRRLVGLFAAMYFGGLRPLRRSAWSRLTLSSLSKAGDRRCSTGPVLRSASSGRTRGRPMTTAGSRTGRLRTFGVCPSRPSSSPCYAST
jgi:hypothetical protein